MPTSIPASGSMFLQMLLGGIAGVALLIKLYWFKLLRLVRDQERARWRAPGLTRAPSATTKGRVFYHRGRVLRALSARALAAWETLVASRFFARALEDGRVVATRRADFPAELLQELSSHWAAVLEHDRIPFVSYPYEWSFSMLRDAALLELELLRSALGEDMVLKDASAYNVQWQGTRPIFIDVGSFEPWTPGDPWVGYLQFCQHFLYPLLLTAYRDVAFQPWLRGSLDGIGAEDINRLFGWRDRLRPGVLTDVYLQARLQAAHSRAEASGSLRDELRRAGFRKQMIVRNVERLAKIVRNLRWRRGSSQWASYARDCSYDAENRELKERFVEDAARRLSPRLVWDLGCNTGNYSCLVAAHADQVIALDGDHLAIDRLYRRLAADGPSNVLPLCNNLTDPSPALGWRHRERRTLSERGRPDLVLCLALVHHLVISANVPVPELLDWLAGLGRHLVLELVTLGDPMVQRLLRNKGGAHHDYATELFEAEIARRFSVLAGAKIQSGQRRLYLLETLG